MYFNIQYATLYLQIKFHKTKCHKILSKMYEHLTKAKHKEKQFFNIFYCTTRCALSYSVLCTAVNFVVQFYLSSRENKFHIVIYPKVHFMMIYTFLSFYILLI